MALRSLNNPIASFIDYLSKTGTDASGQVATPSGLTATGGIISDYTSPPGAVYRAHIFTSSGTFNVTSLGSYGSNVEYLVVAGGGSGGPGSGGPSAAGGGGGAGGLLSNHPNIPAPLRQPALSVSTSPGSYTITIGAGGASAYDVSGNPGNPSSFGPISSTGGGGGGNGNSPTPSGGSGGGGDYQPGGAGIPGQGNPGGAGIGAPTYRGGGGGGAGAPGTSQSGPSTPAPGGDGLPIAIETATAKYYAGGGGAGSWTGNGGPVGLGGLGGGGKGGSPSIPGAENGTYDPTTS